VRTEFDNLPHRVEFAARDEDGTWWAYEVHLNKHDHGCYENAVGRCLRLKEQTPNPDRERALINMQKQGVR
jgi:hypothetical protein